MWRDISGSEQNSQNNEAVISKEKEACLETSRRNRKTIMEAHLVILKPAWATQQDSVKKEEKEKERGEEGKKGKGRREEAGRPAGEMVHQ